MITDSFDNQTRPLITAQDYYGKPKHLVDVCLVTFSRVIGESILANFHCEKIAEFTFPNGEYPIYRFNYQGKNIAFYVSMIGSALAAEMVVETNCLVGATKFVMFGSAGSLDAQQTTNKFVIPTAAYRDEGMSYHYAAPQDYITIKNSALVKAILEELQVPSVMGKVWTTDAILRETVGQAKQRRTEGCIAVEMELAGVQAVCDYHGFALYNFLVTGDVLGDNSYTIGTLADANHNLDKLQLALAIACRV